MKTMIVDDSIVYRTAITKALEDIENINVFKTCSNGKIAIDFLKQNSDTDLIILDMEMPVMDGIETIKGIRAFNHDVTIIVFSSLTVRGAEKTIDALSAGADDFVAKIEGKGNIEESVSMIRTELLPKINAFRTRKFKRSGIESAINKAKEQTSVKSLDVSDIAIKPRLVCIGCSTGGPDALTVIFKQLTEKLTFPLLLVQHMPPVFTQKLAEMLNKMTPNEVLEVKGGETIAPGNCYIAPGDFHMTLNKENKIGLNQSEKVCFVRPSVDVLFNSVAENFSGQVLSIVLTGMGEDGARGAKKLNEVGAYQYIQDRESSIVWGMPGAVANSVPSSRILPIHEIGSFILSLSKRI